MHGSETYMSFTNDCFSICMDEMWVEHIQDENRAQTLPNRNQGWWLLYHFRSSCVDAVEKDHVVFHYVCEWRAYWLNENHELITWHSSLGDSCCHNLMGGKWRHMYTPSRDREPQALGREQGKWTRNLNMQIAPVHVLWTWKHSVTVRDIRTLLGFVHPVSGVNICLSGFVIQLFKITLDNKI